MTGPLRELAGQQRRRERGVPCVTVLAGPPPVAAEPWRTWAAASGRGLAECTGTAREAVLGTWVDALAARVDLPRRAAESLGVDPSRWVPTADQRAAPLDRGSPGDVREVADALLAAGPVTPPANARRVAAHLRSLSGSSRPWWLAAALVPLVGSSEVPALLAAPAGDDPLPWLRDAAPVLAELAEAVPALPVALAVSPEIWRRYQRDGRETHARAVLREGHVAVEPPRATAPSGRWEEERLDRLGGRYPAAVERVRAVGAGGHVAVLERAVGEVEAESADAATADPARSATERFLFELLERVPATAGRFALNAPGGFQFGKRPAEVDMLSTADGVAVEVDGPHHFQDCSAYRRDRRKDYELQKRGLWVLRFCAEDVVGRTDDVLATIVEAVTLRSTGEGRSHG